MENLQDLLDNIKAAAQEGQSAAMDAINAIKQARMSSQAGGGSQPGSETTIEVEPGLTQPKASAKINASNTIIDDPDNLLQSQSKQGSQGNPNQNNTPNGGQQNPSKQNGTDNNSTIDPASGTDGQGQGQPGGQPGQPGQGGQQGNSGQPGQYDKNGIDNIDGTDNTDGKDGQVRSQPGGPYTQPGRPGQDSKNGKDEKDKKPKIDNIPPPPPTNSGNKKPPVEPPTKPEDKKPPVNPPTKPGQVTPPPTKPGPINPPPTKPEDNKPPVTPPPTKPGPINPPTKPGPVNPPVNPGPDGKNQKNNQNKIPTDPNNPRDEEGPQGRDTDDNDKNSKNNIPAKKAPDFEKPKDEHQAPDKQSLTGRKITIARVLDLAQTALNKVNGSITEAVAPSQASIDRVNKNITDLQNLTDEEIEAMSADKFNDLISRVLDNIDKVSQVIYSTDLEARVTKINQELSDPELAKELGREDSMNKQRELQTAEASKREKERYTKGNFKGIEQFNLKFHKAIADQVAEEEDDVDTWAAINRRHYDDGIVAKGTHLEDVPNNTIPSVDVYVDCSGSWSNADIEVGEGVLKQILEFEERGEIETHIYYMSKQLYSSKEVARANGSTEDWVGLINNVKAKGTKNVVVLTDSDPEWTARRHPEAHAVVDGIVYWIWKNGQNAPTLPTKLRGRRDNDQFAFKGTNWWDN